MTTAGHRAVVGRHPPFTRSVLLLSLAGFCLPEAGHPRHDATAERAVRLE
jgi:hypothetical protein